MSSSAGHDLGRWSELHGVEPPLWRRPSAWVLPSTTTLQTKAMARLEAMLGRADDAALATEANKGSTTPTEATKGPIRAQIRPKGRNWYRIPDSNR